MKKINRKGFTLIELLAVIVVLAIVMVIAIPAVLTSIGESRTQAFEASANSIASWFETQYGYCKAQPIVSTTDGYSSTYKGIADTNGCTLGTAPATGAAEATTISSATATYTTLFKEAGASLGDYSATVYFTNGRACVKLDADGATDGNSKFSDEAQSSGC